MELIQVSKECIGNQDAVNAVNAKELHSKLGVKTKFVDWMKRAIEKYGFEDGVDFISFLGKSEGGERYDLFICSLSCFKSNSFNIQTSF